MRIGVAGEYLDLFYLLGAVLLLIQHGNFLSLNLVLLYLKLRPLKAQA